MIHHGINIRRLREAKGLKQDAIGDLLELSQQSISRYETLETIDDETLLKFSSALNVPVDIIKSLDSDLATFVVENNSFTNRNFCTENNAFSIISVFGNNENNNTINKPIEEILKLGKEKEILFERLIRVEIERNKELHQELSILEEIKQELRDIKETLKKT